MKNTSYSLQAPIIEDYISANSQAIENETNNTFISKGDKNDSTPVIVTEPDEVESDLGQQCITNVGDFRILVPIMTLINLQLATFASTIRSFVEHGPNENNNGKGLLLEAYNKFQANELGVLKDKIFPSLSNDIKGISELITKLSSSSIVEETEKAFKTLLSQNTIPANYYDLDAMLEKKVYIHNFDNLLEVGKYEALSQITGGKCKLVEYFKINQDGTPQDQSIMLLVNNDDYENTIDNLKDSAGFIKTYHHSITLHKQSTITTEYFPPKEELAKVVAKSFQKNDSHFIKFCLDNHKFYPGLLVDYKETLYDLYSQGRHDLIDIMVSQKLYGYDHSHVQFIKQGGGINNFMEFCHKGDKAGLEMVKLYLSLGFDPASRDSNGLTPLMHAVTFSAHQLAELNKPESERSEEFKQIMRNKEEITKVLLQDKRTDVNVKASGMTAFQMAVKQGLIKNDSDIQEIRGDHKIMTQLLEAGSDPIFGTVDTSFASKTLQNVQIIAVLNAIQNTLTYYFLNPIAGKAAEYTGYYLCLDKAYNDTLAPLYVATQTALNPSYTQDRLFDLTKTPMIGAYHMNWLGSVTSGSELKDLVKYHLGYHNVDRAFFSKDDLPSEDEVLAMTTLEKHQLAQNLFQRYFVIEECLKKNWFLGWTKTGLNKVKVEIAEAYKMLDTGFAIDPLFQTFLNETLAEKGQKHLCQEIASSPENATLFYIIYAAVKSGALYADLSTRCNIEKLAIKLQREDIAYQPTLGQILQKLGIIADSPHNLASFKDFADLCKLYQTDDVKFEDFLRTLDQIFQDNLSDDGSTSINLIDDAKSKVKACISSAVEGVSKLTGCTQDEVYHQIADKLAIMGAAANACATTGFKYVHDNSHLVQAATGVSLVTYYTCKMIDPVKALFSATKQPIEQDDNLVQTIEIITFEDNLSEEYVLIDRVEDLDSNSLVSTQPSISDQ